MTGLTRQIVEQQLGGIVGRLMTLVGLFGSYAACTGSNSSMDRPLTDALTRMGYSLTTPPYVVCVDADFAALDYRAFRRLMEWAELYTLEQVERDWWRAMVNRMEPPIPLDVLRELKGRVVARIVKLREIVMTPYQSQNVELAVADIVAGSSCDPSLPPAMTDLIWPGLLLPDGLWLYGQYASAFWGFDSFGIGEWR